MLSTTALRVRLDAAAADGAHQRDKEDGPGTLVIKHTTGDVAALYLAPENTGAVFQVETLSNCLGPPREEDGSTTDAAAVCAAGTLYRTHFLGQGDGISEQGVDTFGAVLRLVGDYKGDCVYWTMNNGIMEPRSRAAIRDLGGRLRDEHRLEDEAVAAMELGVLWSTDVNVSPAHRVTQVFVSAVQCPTDRNQVISQPDWEPLACVALRAAYEGTLAVAALLALERNERVQVFLTVLGAGSRPGWIQEAINSAVALFADSALDVFLVHEESVPDAWLPAVPKTETGGSPGGNGKRRRGSEEGPPPASEGQGPPGKTRKVAPAGKDAPPLPPATGAGEARGSTTATPPAPSKDDGASENDRIDLTRPERRRGPAVERPRDPATSGAVEPATRRPYEERAAEAVEAAAKCRKMGEDAKYWALHSNAKMSAKLRKEYLDRALDEFEAFDLDSQGVPKKTGEPADAHSRDLMDSFQSQRMWADSVTEAQEEKYAAIFRDIYDKHKECAMTWYHDKATGDASGKDTMMKMVIRIPWDSEGERFPTREPAALQEAATKAAAAAAAAAAEGAAGGGSGKARKVSTTKKKKKRKRVKGEKCTYDLSLATGAFPTLQGADQKGNAVHAANLERVLVLDRGHEHCGDLQELLRAACRHYCDAGPTKRQRGMKMYDMTVMFSTDNTPPHVDDTFGDGPGRYVMNLVLGGRGLMIFTAPGTGLKPWARGTVVLPGDLTTFGESLRHCALHEVLRLEPEAHRLNQQDLEQTEGVMRIVVTFRVGAPAKNSPDKHPWAELEESVTLP